MGSQPYHPSSGFNNHHTTLPLTGHADNNRTQRNLTTRVLNGTPKGSSAKRPALLRTSRHGVPSSTASRCDHRHMTPQMVQPVHVPSYKHHLWHHPRHYPNKQTGCERCRGAWTIEAPDDRSPAPNSTEPDQHDNDTQHDTFHLTRHCCTGRGPARRGRDATTGRLTASDTPSCCKHTEAICQYAEMLFSWWPQHSPPH